MSFPSAVEWLVRRSGRTTFTISRQVSPAVLLSLLVSSAVQWLRGLRVLLSGQRPRMLFLGRGVQFFNLRRVRFGRGVRLGDHVYVSALGRDGVTFGDNVAIGAFSRIVVCTTFAQPEGHIKIGNDVGIGEFAYLGGAGGLDIGAGTIVGQYFSVHPESHLFGDADRPIRFQGTIRKGISIGSNCWIGSRVTVLDGVTVGDNSVIAAGAVVNRSFPADVVIGGVPARILKRRR